MPELVRAALRAASRKDDASVSNSSNSGSSCPYAAAWSSSSSEEKHDSESSAATAINKDTASQSIDPAVWDLARTSCPAFSDSCPFSNAKNATDVRQTLLQLPTSHWQATYFYQALQHLHLVVQQEPLLQTTDHSSSHSRRSSRSSNHPRSSHADDSSTSNNTDDDDEDDDNDELMGDDSEQYRIPGGCPIKHYTTQPLLPPGIHSFGQAMEECSLAAIMARMAKELEEEEEEKGKIGNPMPDENQDTEKEVAAPIPVVKSLEALSAMQEQLQSVALPPPPPSTPSLAQALKTGTAASHEAAEHVHFVRNFIRGAIDRDLYAQLVLSLFHVYQALEDLLDQHATAAHFDTLHFPKQLHRTAALQEDVDFWWGSNIPTTLTPATQDYVTRLHQIAKDDPVLLVAHAYTRYLGDLSGGRILARVAKKALHLQDADDDDEANEKKPYTDGLAFYHFEHVPNPKQFKDTYRQALDQLPTLSTAGGATTTTNDADDADKATNSMIDKLVLEANVAFLLNMRLFEELDVMANVPGAQVRPLQDALAEAAVAMKSSATTNRGQGGKQLEKKTTNHHNKTTESQNAAGAAAATTCPFAHMGKERPASTVVAVPKVAATTTTTTTKQHHDGSKRCPWPFVFFHDPVQGLKDWQTWCVVAVIAAWAWTMVK